MVDGAFRALGAAHEGSVGVLLEDDTEPGPVYYDVGSGGHVPSTTIWHAYDGRFGRPRAAALRGACACGWRGMAEYPVNWGELGNQRALYASDVDLSGPIADYGAHLSVIRDAAVPLPADLTALDRGDGASGRPVGARTAGGVEGPRRSPVRHRPVGRGGGPRGTGRRVPMREVATALGTSEAAARRYVTGYLRP